MSTQLLSFSIHIPSLDWLGLILHLVEQKLVLDVHGDEVRSHEETPVFPLLLVTMVDFWFRQYPRINELLLRTLCPPRHHLWIGWLLLGCLSL